MKQQLIQRVGIIHGSDGSSAIHWQTWLARKCRALSLETIYPKLPNNRDPVLSAWLEALDKTMPIIGKATALIGHSVGCPTILQLLRTRKDMEKAGLVVLVAPSSRSRGEFNTLSHFYGFYDGLEESLPNLRARITNCHVFASNNDVLVDPAEAKELAAQLGATFHLLSGAGHINIKSGHHTLPEVLGLITAT